MIFAVDKLCRLSERVIFLASHLTEHVLRKINHCTFRPKYFGPHFFHRSSPKMFHFISKIFWCPFLAIDHKSSYFRYFFPTFHHKFLPLSFLFQPSKIINTKYTYFFHHSPSPYYIHHCKNILSSLHIFIHHCTFRASLHVRTCPVNWCAISLRMQQCTSTSACELQWVN